jgi:TIR domain
VLSPEDQAPRGNFEYFFDLAQKAREDQLKKEVEKRVPENVRKALDELPYDVFLAHAGELKMSAVSTMNSILGMGNSLRCFLDCNDLNSGNYPREKMSFALATCRYAVVVLSQHFFEKKHPASELKYAFERMMWMKGKYSDNDWQSLHVVLYDMTVEDYEEKCQSCDSMKGFLPAKLCSKVVVTEWKSVGGTIPWHKLC